MPMQRKRGYRELIDLAYDHTATYLYDRFQKASNGIEF